MPARTKSPGPPPHSACSRDRAARGVSLPVLPAPPTKIRRSKSGPRRAAVLIAVHALFALHLAYWFTRGRTLSPVEPSESMKTLELGEVNAGFVFFAAAILATLIFGRFFCGWGCHIVALQDLCGWLMKRCGVHPKPFRSRLLVYAPIVLAFYMFAWPTLKRLALAPALDRWWPSIRTDLGVAAFPDEGFTNRMATTEFWATFPSIFIALPFLLVCGFAAVYFLGAKGFCTYGCPYGGVFGPIDRLSPGRIIVDHDKCHACGHCTAVCTSNVRVHEEIRVYGHVVDPGCMKCLDCVSVCPNSALSFGFAAPSLLKRAPREKRPRKIYDSTLGEDALLALVFLAVFFAFRGAYAAVPMLMSVGLAGCAAFLAWKLLRLVRDRDVRLGAFQLKRASRLTRPGLWYAVLMALLGGAAIHSGIINYHRWRGDEIYERLGIAKQSVLLPARAPFPDEVKTPAADALRHYRLAAGWKDGGIGLVSVPATELRAALLHLVLDREGEAEATLRRVLNAGPPSDELIADLGRVMRLRGGGADAEALYAGYLTGHPDYWSVREELSLMQAQSGRVAQAISEAEAALARLPPEGATRQAHARTRLTLARLCAGSGRPDAALAHLSEAVAASPEDPVLHENLGAALLQIKGDLPGAIDQLHEAIRLSPRSAPLRFQLGRLELQRGAIDAALSAFDEAETRDPGNPERRRATADLLRAAGRELEALRWAGPPLAPR